MGELAKLPNISKVNEEKLLAAGIDTPERLRQLGNMLYALEGAIRGVRWHDLPKEVKDELKAFHRTLR